MLGMGGVECGNTVLRGKDLLLARLLHWARNKPMENLQARIQHRFFPGPKGFKTGRGLWVPAPEDGCDFGIHNHQVMDESKKSGYRVDAWLMWKHCKSMEHCEYLVAHRYNMVFTFFSENIGVSYLSDMMRAVENKKFDLMACSDRWAVKEFGLDALKGDIPWLQEETPAHKPSRYEMARAS